MDLYTSLRMATALDRLAELEEQDAMVFAARAQALVDVEDLCALQPDAAQALSLVALDIATACGIAQSTASMRLGKARHLVKDLPVAFEHLRQGRLTVGQALVLQEETRELPRQTCAALEARAFPRVLGMTSGDTRRAVKRILVQVDADASELRRQAKQRERQVWNSVRPDGRAVIGAELSAEGAGAFLRALTAIAKAVFGAEDRRTLDQQRADLFAALPHFAVAHLGEEPGPSLRAFLGLHETGTGLTEHQARRIQAIVVVPVETGLDLTDTAAELVDYGPITAGHARELLAAAELRKACSDVRTGRLVALEDTVLAPAGAQWVASTLESELLAMVFSSTPVESREEAAHDPSRGLADFIQLRDQRCVGPGCSQPARSCDLEHLDPYPGGETRADNLGPASRRGHNAKTHGGWTLEPHPDGSVTWTSPLGRRFTRPSRSEPHDLTNLRLPRRLARPSTDGPSTDGPDGEPHDDGRAAF